MVPTCLRLRQGSISQRYHCCQATFFQHHHIIKLFTSFGWACHIKKCLKQRIVAGGRQRARCDTSSLTLLRARTGSLVETQSSSLHVHKNAKYHLMVLIFIYNAKKNMFYISFHSITSSLRCRGVIYSSIPQDLRHIFMKYYVYTLTKAIQSSGTFLTVFRFISFFTIFRPADPLNFVVIGAHHWS